MQYRSLGSSDLVVSSLGLGCNNLGRPSTVTMTQEGTDALVQAAIEEGVTLFDVADIYGAHPGLSEEMLGLALKRSGTARDDVVVASKFGLPMGSEADPQQARGSREYIMASVEGSLKRLGTDYLDLYQFHTPDPKTPIEETLEALSDLVDQGKVRYIGHSNQAGWQIAQAHFVARELGRERFVSAQNHYNLMDRRAELEVFPAARSFGLGILPYFPLAHGLLTGKYSRGKAPEGSRLTHNRSHLLQEADFQALESLDAFALERDLEMIDVAFAWLLTREPISSVIAGATRVEQVRRNARALDCSLSDRDLAQIDEIMPAPEKIALF